MLLKVIGRNSKLLYCIHIIDMYAPFKHLSIEKNLPWINQVTNEAKKVSV